MEAVYSNPSNPSVTQERGADLPTARDGHTPGAAGQLPGAEAGDAPKLRGRPAAAVDTMRRCVMVLSPEKCRDFYAQPKLPVGGRVCGLPSVFRWEG